MAAEADRQGDEADPLRLDPVVGLGDIAPLPVLDACRKPSTVQGRECLWGKSRTICGMCSTVWALDDVCLPKSSRCNGSVTSFRLADSDS